MNIQLRDGMVQVGKEQAATAPDANRQLLAFDNVTNEIKPVLPEQLPISDAQKAGLVEKTSVNIAVTVGNGGDYATINEALEFLTKSRPVYKSEGVKATITLLAGFVMNEQVIVDGIDLSWIVIEGVDSSTSIDGTAIIDNHRYTKGAFMAFDGALPNINQSFNINASAWGQSVIVCSNARCSIYPGTVLASSGVATAWFGMLSAAGSSIDAQNVVVDGFERGLAAGACAIIDFESGEVKNCTEAGVRAVWGGKINCDSANASVNNAVGFYVQGGGIITADAATGSLSQVANEIDITGNGIIFQ